MFKNLKRKILQNENDSLTVTLDTRHSSGGFLSEKLLQDLWLKVLGRKPAIGPPNFEVVDNESRCDQVCQFLKQDLHFPKVIGIDGEFISGPGPWSTWPERHKTFPVAKPDSSGPFLRFLQIARADGYVAIFDVMALKGLPKSIIDLLTDDSTTRFGFSWRSDHAAIDRLISPEGDYKSLCRLGEVFDVQHRWNYLSSPLCRHRIKDIPFDPCASGLADFVRAAFNINIDKRHQGGSGLYWNRPAHLFNKDQMKYAALDALIHLDLGLLFCHWGLWTHGLASKVKFCDYTTERPKIIPSLLSLECMTVTFGPRVERHLIAGPSVRRTMEADEMTTTHNLVVQHDATLFQGAWTRFFENGVGGYWNAYAFIYRNRRFRWYQKRYPSYAKLMSTLLEKKMNSIILNKRPQLKRLQIVRK